MRGRTFLVGIFLIFTNLATSIDFRCDTRYGTPKLDDCYFLLQTFPRDSNPHVFDEEQLHTEGTSWPGIINPFPRRVEQLPKYWSLSQ